MNNKYVELLKEPKIVIGYPGEPSEYEHSEEIMTSKQIAFLNLFYEDYPENLKPNYSTNNKPKTEGKHLGRGASLAGFISHIDIGSLADFMKTNWQYLVGTYLLGKELKEVIENLEFWKENLKKVSNGIKRIKNKTNTVYLSQSLILNFVLDLILTEVDTVEELKIVRFEEFPTQPSFNECDVNDFSSLPERTYLFTIILNCDLHVICIRSNANIKFHNIVKLDYHSFYEDNTN